MKKLIFAIGFCTLAGTAFAQNQPDSIHIMLVENQNGVNRVLDTIVPLSQQQALFTWMEANGWDAPPPPPPPGQGPAEFEHVIVLEGDSGMMHPGNGQRHVMIMKGSCDSLPPIPPGAQMRMKHAGAEGDVVIMRAPMPPPPPGSTVEVNVQHKDTIINGVKHTMIIRTEKIILPEGVQAPPAPPVPPSAPKAPTPPQAPKQSAGTAVQQKELVVYPNPTSSVITVEFDVNAKEKTTLRVVDMNGKTIYTEEIVENESKRVKRDIDLSGKTKGAYTVEVQSGRKVIAERIVLQ